MLNHHLWMLKPCFPAPNRQDCIIDKLDLEQGRMSVALPEVHLRITLW